MVILNILLHAIFLLDLVFIYMYNNKIFLIYVVKIALHNYMKDTITMVCIFDKVYKKRVSTLEFPLILTLLL